MTVDELARRAGLTVRNVRAYQSAGLLPGPRLAGRVGHYDEEHLRRLRTVTRLQARGFSLAAIGELLQAWDGGRTLGQVLGLEAGAPPASGDQWLDELFADWPVGDVVLPPAVMN